MSVQIQAAVLTISDRCARGEQDDTSGKLLVELLEESDALVVHKEIVPDNLDPLAEKLLELAERADLNLIVTTGGTGVAPRDNTPEATRRVIEREVPGMAEAMRLETLKQTPAAMISRAVCGVRGQTLIINLPGSPAGVRECFTVVRPVLPHAIALLAGLPHDQAG